MSWILPFLSLASLVAAQAPNTSTLESTLTGEVNQIDRRGRVITVVGDGNVFHALHVDQGVAGFDALKVGDRVTVRYTESVIVQVRPNAKLTPVQDTTEQARAEGQDVLEQLKTTVTIESIDSQGLFVTYRTHDNRRAIHSVRNKTLLEGIRPGDRVEITRTRARALSIRQQR
jgi:hypothetical protein